jgi:hypothetical protein
MNKLFAVTLFCVCIPFAYGGTLNYTNGDRYIGGTANMERHGKGTYNWGKTANKYIGYWKFGKRHGQGTLILGKGSKYPGVKIVGDWKDDKPWNAKYYKADRSVLGTYTEGKWCAGCGSTNSTSTASSSSSSNTASSSPNIWCVVKEWPKAKYMKGSECKTHNGKAFSSATKAIAEHERLKSTSTMSSGSNYDSAIELEYWQAVKDSDDPDLLQAYLDEYPNGKFAPLARLQIKKLKSD